MEFIVISAIWVAGIVLVMLCEDTRRMIHKWSAPTPLPDVRVGDIWVKRGGHPWQYNEVIDVKDGWVKFKNGSDYMRSDYIDVASLQWFVTEMTLKSRASS